MKINSLLVYVTPFVSTVLLAALPPRVQKRIDMAMMKTNLELQNKSPVVIEAKVIKIKETLPGNIQRGGRSYYKQVHLVIQVNEIIRNNNAVAINEKIYLDYSVFMPNAMPGPKVFSIMVPKLHESYIFYLNNNLGFSARNYSIDSLTHKFHNIATSEIRKNAPKSKTIRFDLALTSQVKEEIKKFLRTHKYRKNLFLKISSYSYKSTDEYSFSLSMTRANRVKNFIIGELNYKEKNVAAISYGNMDPICIDLNTNDFKKPCSEINERVVISIINGVD